jgi:hypothetical protein
MLEKGIGAHALGKQQHLAVHEQIHVEQESRSYFYAGRSSLAVG